MTPPKYQPLSREDKRRIIENLWNACDSATGFLARQIAEMEAMEPWNCEVMENMLDEYKQVAYALRLALGCADGKGI
jgi:hypothetical protein